MVFFIIIGIIAEKAVKRFLTQHYFNGDLDEANALNTQKNNNTDKLVATLVSIVPEIVGLCFFFGAAYYSYFSLFWEKSPFLQLLFLSILLTIALTRILAILSRLIFSPSSPQFRILSISNQDAINIHKFIVGTGGYIISVLMFTVVAFRLGATRNTISLAGIFFASLLLAVSAMAVVVFKNRIKTAILQAAEGAPSWGRKRFASLWHVLTLLYLLVVWVLLINTIDSSGPTNSHGAFVISFFILPIWIVADKFIQWVVKYLMITLKIHDESLWRDTMSEEELSHWEYGKMCYGRCNISVRVCLVFALAIWIGSLWGIEFPLVSRFTAVFFDASVILALSIVLWQVISSWIESKMGESRPSVEGEDAEDSEWGSAAAHGRSYTLLPMIRKFIGSILVLMVTMTILSSMGVDIGPLLAGAGVVGLAIGFGAQKLVADIFSGFFYLLDDAFRVGEYLEAGGVSGLVENITMRNVMLRHHRGMLQIVPHSELGAITNFMRGGIVVKFNLDFPYDADIDKIRKVIKNVGQDMLTDDELGKDFIKPVKSQGVREITNSVMTIRVKFTANPGTHFVIRREAYKRITEALKLKGIAYAHKKVIVDIPNTDTKTNLTEVQINATGAAAHQALEEEGAQDASQLIGNQR